MIPRAFDWMAHSLIRTVTALSILCLAASAATAQTPSRFIRIGAVSNVPIGWTQFCETYEGICDTKPTAARDVVLDQKAWADLQRVNAWVNHTIKPETDTDHYGIIQWWRFPDDGVGACHSYALLKRRMLLDGGWPRSALLMTIVHEANGEGHAVLTVKTDRGEYILDNLTDRIRLWSETPYHFDKRQSQADPNVWVWLDDTHMAAPMVISSLK